MSTFNDISPCPFELELCRLNQIKTDQSQSINTSQRINLKTSQSNANLPIATVARYEFT